MVGLLQQAYRLAGACLLLLAASVHAWDYSSNGGDWSDLGVCGGTDGYTGQSPIDLPESADGDSRGQVFLRYPHVGIPIRMYNNGYSLAMTMPETYKAGFGIAMNASSLNQEGSDVYRLWQVNFHAPSEHLLAGERMPLEMQLMHQRITGPKKTAVISVFFKSSPSTASSWLQNVLDEGLPAGAWDEVVLNTGSTQKVDGAADGKAISVGTLLAGSPFYAYEGSLTVPPCETEVQYLVRQVAVSASQDQLSQFASVLEGTCPPRGNYRSIPDFTTASSVTIIASQDAVSGVAGPTSAAFEPGKAEGPEEAATESVQSDPDLQALKAADSTRVRSAKVFYNKARLSADAGNIARKQALQELDEAQKRAGGVVTPEVEKASAAAALATSQMLAAQNALAAAAERLKDLSEQAEKKSGSTEGKAEGTSHEMELNYHPTVSLPRGLSASPFVQQQAGEEAASQDATTLQGNLKLAPNLRQPDGAPGQIPVAELSPVEEASSGTSGKSSRGALADAVTSAETVVTLPVNTVDPLDTAALSRYGTDLRKAVADSLGISMSRVKVPEVRDTVVPVPVAGATGLLRLTNQPRTLRALDRSLQVHSLRGG